MRALFFCNFPPPLTGQTVGTELVAEMVAPDYEVVRLDTSDGALSVSRSPVALLGRTRRMLERRSQLRRELERLRPAVFYFVASSTALGQVRDALVVRAARGRVGRVIAHVRTGNYQGNFRRPLLAALSRSVVRGVDRFLFLSDRLSERTASYIPAAKRLVVPNTIDRELRVDDRQVADKLEARAARGSLRVAFIANMIPSKGYLDLARALAELAGDGVAVEADFVGAWPRAVERQAFEQYLRDNGLEGIARIRGAVADRCAIRELLIEADVLCLPTSYPAEAQPRSILEALNAATPVVATRRASIPEFIEDGINGYLVSEGAPGEIADALRRLVDPAGWRALAVAARRTYLERFDPSVVRDLLVTAFAAGEERR